MKWDQSVKDALTQESQSRKEAMMPINEPERPLETLVTQKEGIGMEKGMGIDIEALRELDTLSTMAIHFMGDSLPSPKELQETINSHFWELV